MARHEEKLRDLFERASSNLSDAVETLDELEDEVERQLTEKRRSWRYEGKFPEWGWSAAREIPAGRDRESVCEAALTRLELDQKKATSPPHPFDDGYVDRMNEFRQKSIAIVNRR